MILADTIKMLQECFGESLTGARLEKIAAGAYFAGVKLSTGYGGIAYACADGGAKLSGGWEALQGASADRLLSGREGASLPGPLRTALVNALSAERIIAGGYRVIYDTDALDLIDLTSVRTLSMVGAFTPYLKRLKTMDGLRLHVVEKRKEAFAGEDLMYFVPAEQASEVIPLSDVVIITGATIANDTIDGLLSWVRPDATAAVVGPTASLIPDVFFGGNVSLVSGSIVTDADRCLNGITRDHDAHALFDQGVLRKINMVHPGRVRRRLKYPGK